MVAEWIMGNFFSMMVMGMFAVFWLSFGVLQTPSWAIAASYSATGDAAAGAGSKGYNAAVALYLLVWGFWLFTTWIFTLKTNTVFALIFFFAFLSSFLFSGAYWKVATGDYAMAKKLQHVRSVSLSSIFGITRLTIAGWRCNILCSRTAWLLYHCGHDGSRDANDNQPSSWRLVSLLAPRGRRYCGYGEGRSQGGLRCKCDVGLLECTGKLRMWVQSRV
jgi:hypothetical protein